MSIINEAGLYSLVLGSRKPEAKAFKRWITHEVIPSIRKHGGYIAGQETLSDDELLAKALLVAQSKIAEKEALLQKSQHELEEVSAEKKQLEQTVAVQNQQITEMKPKATYYDIVLKCKDLITISVIAKDYGKSAKWMNEFLHNQGVQYKQGNIWLLYQKHAEQGYTSTKTFSYVDKQGENHASVQTYWTQKGRLFIYDLMKSNGFLPLIEQI